MEAEGDGNDVGPGNGDVVPNVQQHSQRTSQPPAWLRDYETSLKVSHLSGKFHRVSKP